MQALVLVGGEGTRLRPLTLTQPKPAIPLVDRPFIRYVVDWLARHEVTEVVMACGFRADDLRVVLGDGETGGPTISYLEEGEPLGTAGPIRLAADQGYLDERFLVLNGDLLTDLDLHALLAAHAERNAIASLALYPVADPSSYGLVRRDDDGVVRGFLEKPEPGQIDTDEVNAGAYVLERSVVDLIPAGRAVSIEREVFPLLVGKGLFGQRLDGYWMDVGTPERYLQGSWDILDGIVETEATAGIDEHAEVDATAQVSDPVFVGSGVEVGPSAIVGPRAVIAASCEIRSGARIAGSVLHAGCRVGADATIEGAILASGVEVGKGAVIESGTVVGEGARIPAMSVVEADSRIEPGVAA
ncbi:MAG: NDP-sugar synthase [Actinomycetota bacterium]|nr:NDP-sugar synthase [Actinomycetota bacterium]